MTDLSLFATAVSTIVSVLAVGIGLAVLIVRATSRLDRRIDRTNDRIDSLGTDLGGRIERVEQGQAELRERMAKLEGLLEGLREAITGRRVA